MVMNYPASYSILSEDEMTYLSGGEDAFGIFDWFLGDAMYSATSSKIQGAIWNSFSQGSTAPLAEWIKSLKNMNAFETVTLAYGIFRIFKLFAYYLT